MNLYEEIYQRAARKFDSPQALEQVLPPVLSGAELASKSDSFYLSTMTRRIFQAGMTHSVINNKWAHFEKVFWGFDPEKVVLIDESFMEKAMQDKGLIRHWAKLQTIPVNGLEMKDLSRETNGFGRLLAEWDEGLVALWKLIAKRFKRMGGQSSSYFLRMVGKDTFILTDDVVNQLRNLNVVDRRPTSKSELLSVELFFNDLQALSNRPLAHISKLLALSID